jgi:hypothetical protein
LIAGIAIVLDSQILVIGAMVLGPEFGAIALSELPWFDADSPCSYSPRALSSWVSRRRSASQPSSP